MSMKAPTILLVSALWYERAYARNETILHGWQSEPDGRGTWTILWSCLATVFICTWSALHLEVPRRHEWWYLMGRKFWWMCIAATAPEWILLEAAENYFLAWKLSKHLKKQGRTEWTLTHMQFAVARGFSKRTLNDKIDQMDTEKLRILIETDQIPGPIISAEELRSRSKSDWIIKTLAILQIVWFGIQTLCRAIQQFQTTALEIMTVAFVFCSVFIYGFYYYCPQDVEFPVVLKVRDPNSTITDDRLSPLREMQEDGSKVEINSFSKRTCEESTSQRTVMGITVPENLCIIFACGFGGIHCLGWNSPFPTAKERLAWRVCSVSTTALPLIVRLLWYIADHTKRFAISDRLGDIVEGVTFIGVPLFYVIGRLALIVLAFMALRALPADTYQTVDWNRYIPHFAAA